MTLFFSNRACGPGLTKAIKQSGSLDSAALGHKPECYAIVSMYCSYTGDHLGGSVVLDLIASSVWSLAYQSLGWDKWAMSALLHVSLLFQHPCPGMALGWWQNCEGEGRSAYGFPWPHSSFLGQRKSQIPPRLGSEETGLGMQISV